MDDFKKTAGWSGAGAHPDSKRGESLKLSIVFKLLYGIRPSVLYFNFIGENFMNTLKIYLFLSVTLWASPSYAYLDPGTGSMILQSILALLGAVAGAWYTFSERIKFYFSQIFKSNKGTIKTDDETEE